MMARMLLLLLGLGAHTLARQSWTKQPQYTEVNPGESAVLSCVIAGKEGDCRLYSFKRRSTQSLKSRHEEGPY